MFCWKLTSNKKATWRTQQINTCLKWRTSNKTYQENKAKRSGNIAKLLNVYEIADSQKNKEQFSDNKAKLYVCVPKRNCQENKANPSPKPQSHRIVTWQLATSLNLIGNRLWHKPAPRTKQFQRHLIISGDGGLYVCHDATCTDLWLCAPTWDQLHSPDTCVLDPMCRLPRQSWLLFEFVCNDIDRMFDPTVLHDTEWEILFCA